MCNGHVNQVLVVLLFACLVACVRQTNMQGIMFCQTRLCKKNPTSLKQGGLLTHSKFKWDKLDNWILTIIILDVNSYLLAVVDFPARC